MGCTPSKEKPQSPKPRVGIGHTERLGSGSKGQKKARQMSMYKKAGSDAVQKLAPKLNSVGHLMPEEVVKRTRSSVRSTQVLIGPDGSKIKMEYAFLSQRGYYPDDVHKANQDDYSITHKFGGEEGDSLFVVYDGHGTHGDTCARYAKLKLPQLMAKYVRQTRAMRYRKLLDAATLKRKKLQESGKEAAESVFNPTAWPILTEEQFERACRKAHVECNEAMHTDVTVKDKLSGTTAVSAAFHNGRLTVCNVGDSRVILGHRVSDAQHEQNGLAADGFAEQEEKMEERDPTQDGDATEEAPPKPIKAGKLVAVPLSRDQTPYRLDERERVKKEGACVMSIDQLHGEEPMHENWGDMVLGEDIDEQGDPPRVWVPNKDYPGCAFTRSIGDSVADDLGVCAEPEMLTTELTSNDEILVLASDGVFEFMTNQAVIDLCAECQNPLEACQHVVKASYEQWLHYEDRTDDITIVVCFLQCDKPPLEDTDGTTEELVGLARDVSGLKPIRTRGRKGSIDSNASE